MLCINTRLYRAYRAHWTDRCDWRDWTYRTDRRDWGVLFRKGDYLQKCGFLSNRLAMCIDFDKFLNTAELVSKAEYNADIAALVYLDMVY